MMLFLVVWFLQVIPPPVPNLTPFVEEKFGINFFQIWDIEQGPDQTVLMAASDGIKQYDARTFQTVLTRKMGSLAIDASGRVFYGALGDIGFLEKDKFGRLRAHSLLSLIDSTDRAFGDVFDTYALDSMVYFRSSSHLFAYTGKSVHTIIRNKRLHRSYPAGKNLIVTVRDEGLMLVNGLTVSELAGGKSVAGDLFYAGVPVGNRLLLGSRKTGFYTVSTDGITPVAFEAAAELGASDFYHATLLPDSSIAFATKRGVIFTNLRGSIIGRLTRENGLPENDAYSVKFIPPNSLWIGLSQSAARLEWPQSLFKYKLGDGVEAGSFAAIELFRNNVYLAASTGIYQFDRPNGERISLFDKGHFKQTHAPVEQFLTLKAGRKSLYAGSTSGLYESDGTKFKKISDLYVRTLAFHQPDSAVLWIGSRDGVYAYQTASGVLNRLDKIPAGQEIIFLLSTGPDELWASGTGGDVYRIDLANDKVDSWTIQQLTGQSQRYPVALSCINNKIRAHVFGKIKIYNRFNGTFEPDDALYTAFKLDTLGFFRIFSGGDLFVYDYNNRMQVSNVRTNELFNLYPLRAVEISSGALVLPDKIWALSAHEVSRFDYPPDQTQTSYNLYFSTHAFAKAREGGTDTLAVLDNETIPASHANFNAAINVSSFYIRDKVEFRWRLKGFDDWSEWSDKQEVAYSLLTAGTYVFEAEARGYYGSAQTLRLQFTVDKVWYLQSQSLAASGVLVLLLLFIGGRIISRRVEKQQQDLYKERQRLEEVQRKEKDLEDARSFQLSMLPKDLPATSYMQTAAIMRTATEVGGDYYDFFTLEADRLIAVIGDASGHGTAAGMMVQITKAGLLSNLNSHQNPDLGRLNDVFLKLNQRLLRMSLTMAEITEPEVRISMAGMPPAFWYQASSETCVEILEGNVPLGTGLFKPREPRAIPWNPGDMLVFLTDGLPEWQNAAGVELGYEVIKNRIPELAHLPLNDILNALIQVGESHGEGKKPGDDLTLLILKKEAIP